MDKIYFHPYFTLKDFYALVLFMILYALLVFFFPNYLNHPDNYIPANPLVTPLSIIPEWYLLVPYAILRIIPNKLLGVLALAASLLILFILPLQSTYSIRALTIKKFSRILFWFFAGSYVVLLLCGALPIDNAVVNLSLVATMYYFSYFIFINPLISFIDSITIKYKINNKKLN